jgi:hypothetical protein
MAQVEIVGDQLRVQIEGMDRLWTFKSQLEIPLGMSPGSRQTRRWCAAGRAGAAQAHTCPG